MVVAWHRRSMACVNQTWPHCVNQMGKTQSKPLAAWHGMGSAWYVWISLYTDILRCMVNKTLRIKKGEVINSFKLWIIDDLNKCHFQTPLAFSSSWS
jgi:hypothetical protein